MGGRAERAGATAGGRGAGGSRGQKLGQQWVLLPHGVVTDDSHLAIAWAGDKGDDLAALKKTQDAPAGPAHERLDVFLRGRGRGMEHQAFAITVGRVDTIEANGVNVRIEPQIAIRALDDGHGAGFAGREAA